MKTLLALAIGLSFVSAAFAVDPSPTPKFAGGQTTGDAANGGPVGNNEVPGDSQSTAIATATPTPSPTPPHKPR
ncbi:MAG: hypothetical protein ABIT76_11285 [Chthoniobacterales bacterium]